MDATESITLDSLDLSDPDLYGSGDPFAAWRLLRERAPVFWNPQRTGPGFWAITKYEDVRRVSREPNTFISSGGTSTQDLERGESASLDYQIMQGTLVITDPPRHTKLRALVNKAFTPQAVSRLEPFVRGVVAQILDEVVPRGECDFVFDVSARLPFVVICELLGIPAGDRPPLFKSMAHLMSTDAVLAPEPDVGIMGNALAVIEYLQKLIVERSYKPREDLITDLVRAEVDGERLSPAEMLALSILLFIAGAETTMNALSGGMLAFVQFPGERKRLEEDAGLMAAAVEEILRWTSPAMVGMVRTATKDVEIRGQQIAAGQKVTLWYPSANRDEDVFADPGRFDVSRSPNDHLVFGYGAHFCLGATLARQEVRVVFEELFRRVGAVELARPPKRLRSNIFWALERMPVRFTPH